jgi:hypothetical protein
VSGAVSSARNATGDSIHGEHFAPLIEVVQLVGFLGAEAVLDTSPRILLGARPKV